MRPALKLAVASVLLCMSADVSMNCPVFSLWDDIQLAAVLVRGTWVEYSIDRGERQESFQPEVDSDGSAKIPESYVALDPSRSNEPVRRVRVTLRVDEVLSSPHASIASQSLLHQQYPIDVDSTLPSGVGVFSVKLDNRDTFIWRLDSCETESCVQRFASFVQEATVMIAARAETPRRIAEWALRLAVDDELWEAGLEMLAVDSAKSAVAAPTAKGEPGEQWVRLFSLLTPAELDGLVRIAVKEGPTSNRFVCTLTLPFQRLPAVLEQLAIGKIESSMRKGRDLEHAERLLDLLVWHSERRLHNESVATAESESAGGSSDTVALWADRHALKQEDGENVVLARHLWAGLIREGVIPGGAFEADWWRPDLAHAAFEHIARETERTRSQPSDDDHEQTRELDEWELKWAVLSDDTEEPVIGGVEFP